MKVIVTGGAGFIGRHLSSFLCAYTDPVIVDLKLGRDHDLRFSDNVNRIFDAHRDASLCIHLAAKVGRLFGEDDPMETITDNVGMTSLVAQACGERGIRMAYASTSEVYGDNGERSCDEMFGPFTLPHNVYGISKHFGEDICRHYAPDELTILRLSMPYGPGLPAGRGRAAIINMLHQALHEKPIPVHEGAERSWCYIGDTVRAISMAISATGTFNVGRDDAAVPMLRVAELACELTGASKGLIEIVPAPPMQTVVKRLSTDRIRALGWRPVIDLEKGMKITLGWVKQLDANGALAA